MVVFEDAIGCVISSRISTIGVLAVAPSFDLNGGVLIYEANNSFGDELIRHVRRSTSYHREHSRPGGGNGGAI